MSSSGRAPFTDDQGRELMYLVGWRLRKLKDHPEYEDLLAEGYLGAVRAVRRADPAKVKWTTAAVQGAWWAVQEYLRRKSPYRKRTQWGTPLPEVTSLEALESEESACLALAEDPAAGVIERLAAEELWQRFEASLAALPEQDAAIVRRCIAGEESRAETAAAAGVSENRVYRLRRQALANFAAREGR